MSFEDRGTALEVLYKRIADAKDELEITTFRRDSFYGLKPENLRCVVMSTNNDVIVHRTSRDGIGRPFWRELEVIFTIIDTKDHDLIAIYPKFRDSILSDCEIMEGVVIQEQKTVGPSDFRDLPNTQAIQCITTMTYQD